jgi:hypothetical protein
MSRAGRPAILRTMPIRRVLALLIVVASIVAGPAPVAGQDARYPEVEAYYAELLACTRSGGWVQEDGTCDTVDAASRAPRRPSLKVSTFLSDELSRPYARRLARAGYLSHYLGGSIGERFAAIGMGDGRYGENLGYAGGIDPMGAVLMIHRLFQDEWRTGGWHWRAMVDKRFAIVGIGVWVKGGRTWLAVDFHS